MKCAVSGGNFAILGKAVHALGKIAEELCFECEKERLTLHAVSSSRSAYGRFHFTSTFFTSYQLTEVTCCKILVRSFLLPFKSIHALEKKINYCNLEILQDKLFLQLNCKNHILKTFELPALDEEMCHPPFPSGNWTNVLIGHSRLLSSAVQNFHNSIEEVTFMVKDGKLILKNYTEDEPDQSTVMHTELFIDLGDLNHTVVEEFASITFCLKELRAFLVFAEGTNVPMTISFDGGGRPVVFSIKFNSDIQVDFVLSTLAEAPNNSQEQHPTEESMDVQSTSVDISGSRKRAVEKINEDCENGARKKSAPPSKKYRSIFGGLLKGRTASSVLREPDEVLASASDDDDEMSS